VETEPDQDSSDPLSSDADDAGAVYINAVKSFEKKYLKKGLTPKYEKIWKKANIKVENWKAKRPAQVQAAAGPPNTLDDPPKRTFAQMLLDAKVAKGECLQCGQPGHNVRSDQCGLRGKPLVDRACAKCGKGLHNADDCPRAYQRQAAASADDLNE
jgi:hypothetical protein